MAIEPSQKHKKHPHDDNKKLLAEGIASHQCGNIDHARRCYENVIDHDPKNPEGYFFLAMLHRQQDEWDSAIKLLTQAHSLAPLHLDILNALGNCHKHINHFVLATSFFQKALQINPNHSATRLNLSSLYVKQGDLKSAIRSLKSLLESQPDHHDATYSLARIYAQESQWDQAYQTLKPLIQQQATTVQSALLLGQILNQRGYHHCAIRALKHTLDQEHEQAECHFQLGIAYDILGQPSKAHWHYEHCIAETPENLEAQYNLATSYVKTHHYQRALPHYLFVLQRQNDHHDALYNIAIVYMQQDQHEQAIDYFQKALTVNPSHEPSLVNLANTYINYNDHEKAIQTYEILIKIKPQDEAYQFTLAALKESMTHAMPNAFIAQLFDQYAGHYEQHLAQALDYQVPQILRECIERIIMPPSHSLRILDIGCGSGLMAETLSHITKIIDGIDLSPEMINIAKKKALYQNLFVGNFAESTLDSPYDLLIAADVLPYVSSLEQFLTRCFQCLASNGYLVFTTESSYSTDTYTLQKTLRYGHHPEYIVKSLSTLGFDIICDEKAILRQQKGQPLEGHLFIAYKNENILDS